jgi:hypothetical protein
MGGFGSAVLEALNDLGLKPDIRVLGQPDVFYDHGSIPRMHREVGIDAKDIPKALLEMGLGARAVAHDQVSRAWAARLWYMTEARGRRLAKRSLSVARDFALIGGANGTSHHRR